MPDRVSALIIVDSDAGAETLFRRTKYRMMGFGARTVGLSPFLTPICRMMFGETTRSTNPALVEEWRRIFSDIDVPSALHGLNAVTGRDSVLSRLAEISVPCLVVVGQEDGSLPPARARQIHQGIAGSQYVEIAGSGHLSALEQPEQLNEAIASFLDPLCGSGAADD